MKNKKINGFIAILICILVLIPDVNSLAYELLNMRYTANISVGGELTISSKSEMLAAPWKTLNKESAIKKVTIKNSSLNSLEKVNVIGSSAFFNCNRMESITMPDSVTTIGSVAFGNCKSLRHISFSRFLQTIENFAFQNCINLYNITLPDSIKYIGWGVFYGCTNLETVSLSNSITIIEPYTFKGCENLKTINIPNSVTEIRGAAFEGCLKLECVFLSDNITSIASDAFAKSTVLGGKKGSYVEKFAFENGYTFLDADSYLYNCIKKFDIDSLYNRMRYSKRINSANGVEKFVWGTAYYLLNNPIDTLILDNKKNIIKYYLLENYVGAEQMNSSFLDKAEKGLELANMYDNVTSLYDVYCGNIMSPMSEDKFCSALVKKLTLPRYRLSDDGKTFKNPGMFQFFVNDTKDIFGEAFVNKYLKNGQINSPELVEAMKLVGKKSIQNGTDLKKLKLFKVDSKFKKAGKTIGVLVDNGVNIAHIYNFVKTLNEINEDDIFRLQSMKDGIKDENYKQILEEVIYELEYNKPYTWFEVGLKAYSDDIVDILVYAGEHAGKIAGKIKKEILSKSASVFGKIANYASYVFLAQDIVNFITGFGKDAEAYHEALVLVPFNHEQMNAVKDAKDIYIKNPTEKNKKLLLQKISDFYNSALKLIDLDIEFEFTEVAFLITDYIGKATELVKEKAKLSDIEKILMIYEKTDGIKLY